MAKKRLTVDTGEIASAVNEIKTQLNNIQETRDYVAGKALSELDPIWAGPAKDAYAAELASFIEGFKRFIESGEALNEALDKAKQKYEEAERNAVSKVAALPR